MLSQMRTNFSEGTWLRFLAALDYIMTLKNGLRITVYGRREKIYPVNLHESTWINVCTEWEKGSIKNDWAGSLQDLVAKPWMMVARILNPKAYRKYVVGSTHGKEYKEKLRKHYRKIYPEQYQKEEWGRKLKRIRKYRGRIKQQPDFEVKGLSYIARIVNGDLW